MGDQHDGLAFLHLQILEQFHDLCLDGNVQRGGGLVADDQLRVADHGDGNHHALFHAAGELMGVVVDALLGIRDAQLAEHLQNLHTGFLLLHAGVLDQALSHLVTHLVNRVQAGHGVLEHHGHVRAAQGAHLRAVGVLDLFQMILGHLAVPQGVVLDVVRLDPGILAQETHDGVHGHALAAAGLTHNRQRGATL